MSETLTATPAEAARVRDDITDAIRSVAMLADITVSVWSADRTDQKIMDKAKADAGAVGNVGRAVKNRLAGADEKLRVAKAAYAAVRMGHYGLTLPWVSNPQADRQTGPRLLPTRLFDAYMKMLGTRKVAAEAALEDFLADYPDAVNRAKANLAGLADADYPGADEVRRSFRIGFEIVPVPHGSQFSGLPDATLVRLAAKLRREQEVMVETATKAMWDETRERLSTLAGRLAEPDARLHATTVTKVADLPALVSAWNVIGDSRADAIADALDDMMEGITIKDLRENADVRKSVADKASRVVDRMNQMGV